MKKKLLLILALSAICLAGCSKGGKYVELSSNGKIMNDGVETDVTGHSGIKATLALGTDNKRIIEFTTHKKFDDCKANPDGVLEKSITKSETTKGLSYFISNNGTRYTMHYKGGDGILCATVKGVDRSSDSTVVMNQIEQALKTIQLDSSFQAKYGPIIVHDTDYTLVTGDVTGIKIGDNGFVGSGTIQTTGTTEIGKVTVGTISDGSYDYYSYGDYYIQVLKGFDVKSCITITE